MYDSAPSMKQETNKLFKFIKNLTFNFYFIFRYIYNQIEKK